MTRFRTTLAVALFVLGPMSTAVAHTRSMSYSHWVFDESGVTVSFKVTLLELSRFPEGIPEPSYFADALILFSGDDVLPTTEALRMHPAPDGWARFRWRIPLDDRDDLLIRSELLRDVVSEHAHIVRIVGYRANDAPLTAERVLTYAAPAWELDDDRPIAQGFLSFVALGIRHILSGYDHLAFVLCLLLLATTFRQVAWLVTGFTVAHSITLALAVTGWVRPEAAGVEILIAFSIALIAAENLWLIDGKRGRGIPVGIPGALLIGGALSLWGIGHLNFVTWTALALFCFCHLQLLKRNDRANALRTVLTFAFGLVHGFGFAGVLLEMELPVAQRLTALLGFNTGVELGQLAIVLLIWPLLWLLLRWPRATAHRHLAELGSTAMLALGLYWFIVRNWS
ncbi:MAG: HupE/UreJ family protein [Candidatus Hydrogenedentes bacterium]|nr:HupE/UreJ family protein [Candidatus Hydrogenedentota bacterium]